MKLFHISQSESRGYDTYSDMVVCAESVDEARQIHPYDHHGDNPWKEPSSVWCKSPDQVEVKYLGEASPNIKKGIICASFHAG